MSSGSRLSWLKESTRYNKDDKFVILSGREVRLLWSKYRMPRFSKPPMLSGRLFNVTFPPV